MNWLIDTLGSSIGKKLMMGITGLCFCGFLLVHLIGNLTLYGGPNAFGAYAAKLHSLGPLITVAEVILLLFAGVHVSTGLLLFYQNVRARPFRYTLNKREGGRTIGSATMPYTGLLLLAFIVFHLLNFHFAEKTPQTLFQLVAGAFQNLPYVVIYVLAMIVAAVHVSHGFWSAFHTLGLSHPKYEPLIKGAGIALSFLVGIGFGMIPVYLAVMT